LSKIENLFGSIDLFGDEDDDNVMEYENEETEDDEDEEISDELSLSLLSRAFGKRTSKILDDSLEVQVAEVDDLKSDIGTLSSTASDKDSSLKHLKADFQTVTEQVCVLQLVP